MSDYKLGFIGCGNMGGAMLGGILRAEKLNPEEIIVSVGNEDEAKKLRESYHVLAITDNASVAKKAEKVILAVKPNVLPAVLSEIAGAFIMEETLLISIAAGQSIASIENGLLGEKTKFAAKIIRVMPNVNAMVGQAMSALCGNENVSAEELEEVRALFECFGRAAIVSENLMDVVTGLSGSSPAFVFQFIEALSDGAVAEGMPRDLALEFAAQTVLGSAKMVLQTGTHPGRLKDMVCSPGGTTIEGVAALEQNGFRNAAISAVRAATEKSREL